MKRGIVVGLLALLAGCQALMPFAQISEKTSAYDKGRSLHLSTSMVWQSEDAFSTSPINLSATWDEQTPNLIILSTEIPNSSAVYFIEELSFNVDGQEVNAFRLPESANISYQQMYSGPGSFSSAASFSMPIQDVDRLIAGKQVVMRTVTSRGSVTSLFSNAKNASITAKDGLSRLLTRVKGQPAYQAAKHT